MRWMEQCAYIAASRVGRGGGHLLTASMDSIAFLSPTRVGDIMYITAQVTARAVRDETYDSYSRFYSSTHTGEMFCLRDICRRFMSRRNNVSFQA